MIVIDYTDGSFVDPEDAPVDYLPESAGRNLDTIEKARRWLADPDHWFRSKLFILKFDGLVPSVSEEHGRRLLREPWDDGLPWCVVYEQRRLRRGDGPDRTEEKSPDELEMLLEKELASLLSP